MKTISVLLILVAAHLLSVTVTRAQTVIASLPYTINAPGNYVLGASFVYLLTPANRLTINSHNVTLDLCGYSIYSPPPNSFPNAIHANNKGGLTIRNGKIIEFGIGVNLDNPNLDNYNANNLVERIGFWEYVACHSSGGRGCNIFQNNQISIGRLGCLAIAPLTGILSLSISYTDGWRASSVRFIFFEVLKRGSGSQRWLFSV